MELNLSKEMIISFLRIPLERAECHKVLGPLLQSNLKWNTLIEYITKE